MRSIMLWLLGARSVGNRVMYLVPIDQIAISLVAVGMTLGGPPA